MIERTLQAVHSRLFASSELQDKVGANIHYARGPVNSTWPQVIYFDVSNRTEVIADHDKVTVQFSIWDYNKFNALKIQDILYKMWLRYSGIVTVGDDPININWTELVEMSALPQADPDLYGYQLRFEIRTRGENIKGD